MLNFINRLSSGCSIFVNINYFHSPISCLHCYNCFHFSRMFDMHQAFFFFFFFFGSVLCITAIVVGNRIGRPRKSWRHLFSPSYEWIEEQTGFFSIGLVTILGEEKLWIQTAKNRASCHILAEVKGLGRCMQHSSLLFHWSFKLHRCLLLRYIITAFSWVLIDYHRLVVF